MTDIYYRDTKRAMDIFTVHALEQNIKPDIDKEQWMAYQTLKLKYPNITYQSHNGYHCDGIADYKLGVRWEYDKIIDLSSKEILLNTKPFHTLKTNEIVNTWMRVLGETENTKTDWLDKL